MTDSQWTFSAVADRQIKALDSGSTGNDPPTDATSLARWILAATERGFRREQAVLGAQHGTSSADDQRAVATLREHATNGNDECQLQLGTRYGTGEGVPRDSREAFRWYRAAAEGSDGHPDAQLLMGSSLLAGVATRRDDTLAARCLKSAADQGDDCARLLLGACFAEGRGVAQDRDEAIRLFNLASGGDARANSSSRSKAIVECLREGISESPTPAAPAITRSWSDRSSSNDYALLKKRAQRGELCYYCMEKPPTKTALHAADGSLHPACDACFQAQVELGKARQRWSVGCMVVAVAIVAVAVSQCSG